MMISIFGLRAIAASLAAGVLLLAVSTVEASLAGMATFGIWGGDDGEIYWHRQRSYDDGTSIIETRGAIPDQLAPGLYGIWTETRQYAKALSEDAPDAAIWGSTKSSFGIGFSAPVHMRSSSSPDVRVHIEVNPGGGSPWWEDDAVGDEQAFAALHDTVTGREAIGEGWSIGNPNTITLAAASEATTTLESVLGGPELHAFVEVDASQSFEIIGDDAADQQARFASELQGVSVFVLEHQVDHNLVVPEPATGLLVTCGIFGVALCRRRRAPGVMGK